MKNFLFQIVGLLLMGPSCSFAQSQFSQCSAAFLDGRMIVTEYSAKGTSAVKTEAVGTLKVCTANLGEGDAKAVDPISFKVAIRDKTSQTLMMYSASAFDQLPIQDVLKKCRKGDSIVLITTDSRYALPHNEIKVL